MTTATISGAYTFTGRAIGRCRKCKKVHTLSPKVDFGRYVTKCECGNRVELRSVYGSYSEKECDGRCTGATGPQCDCKCGGENHGAGHLGAVA